MHAHTGKSPPPFFFFKFRAASEQEKNFNWKQEALPAFVLLELLSDASLIQNMLKKVTL